MSDGGRDEPDDRDYIYEELFWAVEITKKVAFPKDRLIVQDQSSDQRTRMACSRFAGIHIHNAQQIIEHWPTVEQVMAKEIWEMYLGENAKAEKEGATLQSILNQLKKLGFIEWYAKCTTDETRKQAIDKGHWLITWSLYGDWTYVRDYKVYRERADGRKAWHLFDGVGYNDKWRECLNSFWPNNGYFLIPYEYTKSLYSTYAIIDKDESGVLQAYKDQLLLDEGERLWIRNWNNPKANVSRADAVLMLMRSRNVA